MCGLNLCTFIQNTDLDRLTWRRKLLPDETLEMRRAPASSAVTRDQFLMRRQGKTRLVCGARYWSVISIADAAFCRRQFRQTQGSPVSAEWLKWNSCLWEILKRALLFSSAHVAYIYIYLYIFFLAKVCIKLICTTLPCYVNKHTPGRVSMFFFQILLKVHPKTSPSGQMLLISALCGLFMWKEAGHMWVKGLSAFWGCFFFLWSGCFVLKPDGKPQVFNLWWGNHLWAIRQVTDPPCHRARCPSPKVWLICGSAHLAAIRWVTAQRSLSGPVFLHPPKQMATNSLNGYFYYNSSS